MVAVATFMQHPEDGIRSGLDLPTTQKPVPSMAFAGCQAKENREEVQALSVCRLPKPVA